MLQCVTTIPFEPPTDRGTVSNDRAFTIYALTLVAIIGSVITASVMTGIAMLPSAGVFLEHLALSAGFRAAYKSFGGFDWLYELADAVGLYERREVASGFGADAMA
jgi:hypothetical protein